MFVNEIDDSRIRLSVPSGEWDCSCRAICFKYIEQLVFNHLKHTALLINELLFLSKSINLGLKWYPTQVD